jgi:hypothetical protein
MKTYIKNLLGLAVCMAMFAFSSVGGERYSIQLNDRVLVDQLINSKSTVPNISLAHASASDQLSVDFNECGRVGTSRRLTLKNEKDSILKEWNFKDSEDKNSMTFSVKDIQALKRNERLKLYYTSENSTHRLLAILNLTDDIKAKN